MTDEKRSGTADLPDEAEGSYAFETSVTASDPRRPSIAIVGSGPSGCYVAGFLKKEWPQSELTIFESMPTPYGLVRYGIAADHQGTKNVTRQFDRLFMRDGVQFAGNVCVGADIDFAELARCFDIVVLATGLPQDRPLSIPQQPGSRVIGARTLLGALNGHPVELLPRTPDGRYAALGQRLAVVGMGNVAMDVVRLMSKDIQELNGSDIDDELLGQIRPTRPTSIDVVSRSGLSEAKFDLGMLRELLALPNIDMAVSSLGESEAGPAAKLLRAHVTTASTSTETDSRTQVRLHFELIPESIESSGGHTVLRANTPHGTDGATEFVVDSVITAIGFTHGAPDDRSCPTDEWAGDNVYRVGWLSRGPRGAIPENRKDARRLVETIIADAMTGQLKFGKAGFAAVAPSLRDVVTFTDWQRLEAFEHQEAPLGRCRRKITDRSRMLEIAMAARESGVAISQAQVAVRTQGHQPSPREL